MILAVLCFFLRVHVILEEKKIKDLGFITQGTLQSI